ncbi:hypothetical protein Pcinc_022925 [Petrolisthes cinctipes]|uniref:Uncharacterized protein n=1 Tax=Petrolisthes cinctipes TaxID=88211 RepID=A0AAE1FDK0_PETCI|nr:hypothetical protein Pcinc_022925 [Petrolisthes cinctipes]
MLCLLPVPDDIPIQTAEDGKQLTSISEDDGEERITSKPIRTPQGSGREKDKDKEGGKEKITKFASTTITIPNLGKRKDKEKAGKNGVDRKDDMGGGGSSGSGKKKDRDRHSGCSKYDNKEKEVRSNGTGSNRNSVILNSDSDGGGGNEVTTILINQPPPPQSQYQQQQPPPQQYEMKVILSKSPRHCDTTVVVSSSGENLPHLPNTSNSTATSPQLSSTQTIETVEERKSGGGGEEDTVGLDHLTRDAIETNGAQNHIPKIV